MPPGTCKCQLELASDGSGNEAVTLNRRFNTQWYLTGVQFFFNETKSKDEVSCFWLWDSRCENPVVGF